MAGSKDSLIVSTNKGLYCPQGDFFIDPLRSVQRAVITHAHSDHARSGSKSYLTVEDGLHVLRSRIGSSAPIETAPYGRPVTINGVTVSFHSAGHVLGSSQVRLEYKGQVWVVSGDYKTMPDPTCAPFEQLRCNCFISESTFGLPIYRWPDPDEIAEDLNSWWQENKRNGLASVVFAYSFGKAQRILKMLNSSIGPIYVHATVDKITKEYIATGVQMPEYGCLGDLRSTASLSSQLFAGAMIIAPPSSSDAAWLQKIGEHSSAFASGWMRIRGNRKRHAVDRGFILSDHADWSELLDVISATGAEEVIIAHGYVRPLVRHLKESGIKAKTFRKKTYIRDDIADRTATLAEPVSDDSESAANVAIRLERNGDTDFNELDRANHEFMQEDPSST